MFTSGLTMLHLLCESKNPINFPIDKKDFLENFFEKKPCVFKKNI